jgi:glycosyltransferase involved in cell wall biosynthesis
MNRAPVLSFKPKVLISGHLPPPPGGVGAYYQALLNSSLPQRVDFHFVETSTHKRLMSQSGIFSLSNVIAAVEDCWRYAHAVIQVRPRLSHIATAFGLSFIKHSVCVIIARLFGSRVLLHPHCGFPALYLERPRWWQWYFRIIMRLTNGVIALSTEWNQLCDVVPGCKVYYLPNAIDLSNYRGLFEKRKPTANNHMKALYLGHLGIDKGSFDILEAAKDTAGKNVPVIFDLVGSDLETGDKDRLKAQVERDGLQNIVNLLPYASGHGKTDAFCGADVFVYPSYSEGMPLAVIEAMACGLPIIATKVGGLPDLVKDGVNGLLIEPKRPDQLAQALQFLSSDPELRLSMGRNSFQIAFKEFDLEVLVSRLIDIYNQALV